MAATKQTSIFVRILQLPPVRMVRSGGSEILFDVSSPIGVKVANKKAVRRQR